MVDLSSAESQIQINVFLGWKIHLKNFCSSIIANVIYTKSNKRIRDYCFVTTSYGCNHLGTFQMQSCGKINFSVNRYYFTHLLFGFSIFSHCTICTLIFVLFILRNLFQVFKYNKSQITIYLTQNTNKQYYLYRIYICRQWDDA